MKLRGETAAPAGPSIQGLPMLKNKLSGNQRFLDDPIVPMTKEFADARGSILPLADEEMKSAVLITSKAGSIRANHYHKTDWHYCYVLSGSIDYYLQTAGIGPPRYCRGIRRLGRRQAPDRPTRDRPGRPPRGDRAEAD